MADMLPLRRVPCPFLRSTAGRYHQQAKAEDNPAVERTFPATDRTDVAIQQEGTGNENVTRQGGTIPVFQRMGC